MAVPNRRTQTYCTLAVLVGLALGLCPRLWAEALPGASTAEPGHTQTNAAPADRWIGSAFLGLTLTRGNSKTFLGNLTLDGRRQSPRWELGGGLSAGYGESTVEGETDKTAEYVRGFGQYDRLFHRRGFVGLRTDAEYDAIAGVDYRVRLSPLVGWYLIQRTNTQLRVELGPSWVFENLSARPSDQYTAFRAGQRFEHRLNNNTRLWQSMEYIPELENWTTRYLLIAEVGADAAITRRVSLSVVFQDNYNNDPPPGRKANDLRLLAGLRYKF
jgi:putative salt-induced outer membrane protein YdiY